MRAFLATIAVLVVLGAPRFAHAEELTVATMAPAQSPWGKVYDVWSKAVEKRTDGALRLTFYFNGQMGDEEAVVGKLRAGQLDAATLTSAGLARIHRPILAFQIPGLFRAWERLDAAREALRPRWEAELASEGFQVLGWGDIGAIRGMSKGFEVRVPSDLEGKRPMAYRGDSIGPVVYQLLQVTPVRLGVSEVLGNLSTGSINVLSAPAIAAEQLQWAPHLDHIGEGYATIAIGALIGRKARLDALPGDLRQVLLETGAIASRALKERIRTEDQAAYERLTQRMTVVRLTDSERAAWAELFRRTAERLAQSTFEPELIKRLVELSEG